MLQEILEIQAKGYVGSKLEGRGSRACVEKLDCTNGQCRRAMPAGQDHRLALAGLCRIRMELITVLWVFS